MKITLPPMPPKQLAIITADDPDLLIEGSPRSAKSWGVAAKIHLLAQAHVGIQTFYSRYKDESLGQLRDVWNKVMNLFPAWSRPTWNSSDQSWDYPNPEGTPEGQQWGSKVWLSSIKSSQDDLVHSKYKGKTLAVIVVEEAAELPKVNWQGLRERLSQSRKPSGEPYRYPLQFILVTNCVDTDHWIAQEYPDEGVNPVTGRRTLRLSLYDNAKNLGPDVMARYERDYPEGSPLRRTVIEGRRGVTLAGKPVYSDSFRRRTHVHETRFSANYALLEGWDFGSEKPAVVWLQYWAHLSAIRILGAVKGSEVFLETFAPRVLEIRRRLFPHATEIRSWCDPTGVTGNHGMEWTAVTLLHQLGIPAQPAKDSASNRDANDPDVRNKAIEVIGGYQQRVCLDGSPGFLIPSVTIELVKNEYGAWVEQETDILATAFEAGYVWDTKAASDAHPNIRKPKKGTRYDDLMNALEYIVTGERIPLAPSLSQLVTAQALFQTAPQRVRVQQLIAERLAMKQAQRDTHPVDGRVVPDLRGGGYFNRRPR